MTDKERLERLESTVNTLTQTVDLSVSRIGWLRTQAEQISTADELAELERVELLAIFEIEERGGPSDQAAARKILDALGCTAPDSPAELSESV